MRIAERAGPAVLERVPNVWQKAGLGPPCAGASGACLLPPSGAPLRSLLFEDECRVYNSFSNHQPERSTF